MGKWNIIYTILFCIVLQSTYGQSIVVNPTHTQLVVQNSARRLLSETVQQQSTERINSNLNSINENFAKVIFVRNQIYESLVNVNEALKDGKMILHMGQIVSDIGKESSELMKMVKQHPEFAPFAERRSKEIVGQALGLFNDVNTYIIGSNRELLMNHNARDEMLILFRHRLILLRASIYGTRNSISWAVRAGLWKSLNPFQSWINQDKVIIDDIIRKQNALKL